MGYIKWVFWITFWVLVASFFHYTLPQHDVARVSDTYEKRIDFGANSIFWAAADVGNAATTANHDVFFIQTRLTNDQVMVYRNEDTGWGWPPYFKFDTSNLQAEASDLKSGADAPQWVVIKHYGWRNEFMSIYPNAVGVREVSGPDVRIIPWVNIIIYVILAFLLLGAFRLLQRFKRRKIDPVLGRMEEKWDSVEARASDVSDSAGAAKGGVIAWFKSWFG